MIKKILITQFCSTLFYTCHYEHQNFRKYIISRTDNNSISINLGMLCSNGFFNPPGA